MPMRRRDFLKAVGVAAGAVAAGPAAAAQVRPNIILAMSDDQGWGDTGYNGHPTLKTPNLDAMAASGIRFDNFYSAAPVCSPTRASCLTGRHPYRCGILGANSGNYDAPSRYVLPPGEATLAELLKAQGYRTGHFGKWHLGDFSGPMKSTPHDQGFDEYFSTVRKVPTVDPFDYILNGEPYTEPLKGDDSAVIMDRVLPFIRESAAAGQPFFAVVWFHAPHEPVLATDAYRALYPEATESAQHFWGTISALDHEMGRLRQTLRELGVADDTMLWYCSDNGPVYNQPDSVGLTGGRRAGKGTLFEGGVRVPGLLEWPRRFPNPAVVDARCSTSDYVPTIADWLGLPLPDGRPYDGESIAPVLAGKAADRTSPLFFHHHDTGAVINGDRKLLLKADSVEPTGYYRLDSDPQEADDLRERAPAEAAELTEMWRAWRASVTRSAAGADYPAG